MVRHPSPVNDRKKILRKFVKTSICYFEVSNGWVVIGNLGDIILIASYTQTGLFTKLFKNLLRYPVTKIVTSLLTLAFVIITHHWRGGDDKLPNLVKTFKKLKMSWIYVCASIWSLAILKTSYKSLKIIPKRGVP